MQNIKMVEPTIIELIDSEGFSKKIIYDIQQNSLFGEHDSTPVSLKRVGKNYIQPNEPWEHYIQKNINPISFGLKKGPFRLIKIQLGLNCNFSCDYCAQSDKDNSLEVKRIARSEDVERFLDNVKSKFSLDEEIIFELWGGEPFLYWKVFQQVSDGLLTFFPNCKIVTTSNGSLITEEITNWILNNQRVEVILSHDGPGKYRDEDILFKPEIYNLYHKLIRQDRFLKFNCVLTIDNLSVTKIRDYIAEKLNVSPLQIILLTEGLAVPINHEAIVPSLENLKELYNEMINGKSLFIYGHELIDFFDTIALNKPNYCIEQKCGLDREDVLVINLRTQNIVTCQNTLPEGKHNLGHLNDLNSVQLNTVHHWRSRNNCSNCQVLVFCKGCCLYLENENFESACHSQFFYRLPFLCASIYWITGLRPVSLYSSMGNYDLSVMTS